MATDSQLNSDPFSNAQFLEVANHAVDKAIETHRRLGQSIVVMRDGKVTWIAPEDIPPLENSSRRVAENAEET